MIALESKLKSADNAGAVTFKCITIYGGFRRRYARLGEMVGSVAQLRRVYRADTNKKFSEKSQKRKQKSTKSKTLHSIWWKSSINILRTNSVRSCRKVYHGAKFFRFTCCLVQFAANWQFPNDLMRKYRSVIQKSKGRIIMPRYYKFNFLTQCFFVSKAPFFIHCP